MSEPQGAKKTILVIEDDPETCLFLQALLSKQGFRVVAEQGGRAGLVHLRQDSGHAVDLVILDLMMPQFSGYEVLRELQQPGYQNAPVFIVTARALDSGTVELIRSESNVWEFWNKPIESQRFVSRVHELLGTQAAR